MSRTTISLLAAMLVLAGARPLAHSAPFSYLDLKITGTATEGTLVVHDFDVAHDVGVADPETLRDPAVAARYRDMFVRLMDSRLAITSDGRRRTLEWTTFETVPARQSLQLGFRIQGERPATLAVDALLFPYDPVHQTFVNVYEDGTLRQQAILSAARSDAMYYAGTAQGALAVIRTFVPLGIDHILIGPDHVLFLVGLLLLGGSLGRLAAIVTAFTLGHSVTLSLAALDLVSPPTRLIEPAIALSIVFVGADNLLYAGRQPRETSAHSSPARSGSCTASASRRCSRSSGSRQARSAGRSSHSTSASRSASSQSSSRSHRCSQRSGGATRCSGSAWPWPARSW